MRVPLCVLSVGDRVADNVLEEQLENTTGLLVDETRDTLHTTTTSETADSRLGNALDAAHICQRHVFKKHQTMRVLVTKNLAMTLGSALAETLATLSTARHC